MQGVVRSYDDTLVLKDKQMEALMFLVDHKKDLIVNLPVGFGKSVIFHVLPQVLGEGVDKPVVLVISPLNVIKRDQRVALNRHNISCCRLDINANVDECDHGDKDEIREQYACKPDADIDRITRGDFSVVLCHPEALLNTKKGMEILNSELQQHAVAVVIDECHILEE